MNLAESRSLRLVESSYFQHAASAAYIALMMVLISMIATGCLIRAVAKGHVRETLMASLYEVDTDGHTAENVLNHLESLAAHRSQLDERSLVVSAMEVQRFNTLCLINACQRLSDTVQFVDVEDERWLGVGVRLTDIGTYFVGYDLKPMLARVQIAPLIAGLLLFMMLIVGLIFSLRNSRINLARIDGVLAYMRQFPNGSHAIVPKQLRKDEIDHLGVEVHQNLQLIHRLVNEITHLSHHVAHELRTPLTRMQNHILDIIDQADGKMASELQVLLDESNHIQHLFSALMRLGEIETGRCQACLQKLNVESLFIDLMEYYEPLADDCGCQLNVQCPVDLTVRADKTMLFQAVANMLENAFKYAPQTKVILFAERHGNQVSIGVADHGVGIEEAAREQAQERFQRLTEKTDLIKGHGLGLALVKAIAERHDGTVTMNDNQPGLKIAITMPCDLA